MLVLALSLPPVTSDPAVRQHRDAGAEHVVPGLGDGPLGDHAGRRVVGRGDGPARLPPKLSVVYADQVRILPLGSSAAATGHQREADRRPPRAALRVRPIRSGRAG